MKGCVWLRVTKNLRTSGMIFEDCQVSPMGAKLLGVTVVVRARTGRGRLMFVDVEFVVLDGCSRLA